MVMLRLVSNGMFLLICLTRFLAAQEVTIPLPEFETLRHRANPPVKPVLPPAPLPVPYALESNFIEISAGPVSAQVQQKLALTLFDDEWHSLSLPIAGSMTRSDLGKLDGHVSIDKQWKLNVRGKGKHVVILHSVLPVRPDDKATRPTWSFELPIPAVAACEGIIRCPEEVEEVSIGSPSVGSGGNASSGYRFVAKAETMMPVTLFGKAIAPKRTSLELKYQADVASLTTVSRTHSKLRVWVTLKIIQGQMETVTLDIPTPFSVLQVTGSPQVGWETKGNQLVVTPLAPAENSLELQIHLSGPELRDFASPMIVPHGTAHQFLVCSVKAEGDGLISLVSERRFRSPDRSESSRLPKAFTRSAPSQIVVDNPASPPEWKMEWADGSSVLAAQIDRMMVDAVVGNSGMAMCRYWLQLRSTGAESLQFKPPPGFQLVHADLSGIPVVPGVQDENYRIPLTLSSGIQTIRITGLLPLALEREKGSIAFPLPSFSIPVSRVEFVLSLPGERKYTIEKSSPIAVELPLIAPQSANRGSAIVSQVAHVQNEEDADDCGFFSVPEGYLTFRGGWDALSSTLAPIRIESTAETIKRSWY